jgi:hypothetical protein
MLVKRKTPTFEARQWNGTKQTAEDLIHWMGNGEYVKSNGLLNQTIRARNRVYELNGEWTDLPVVFWPTDYILNNEGGEFIAIRKDIFEKMYEEI